MRVLYLTNIPSPYRVDFFNELGKSCELTVLYEGHTATDRDPEWISDHFVHFNAAFLKGPRVTNDLFFCPGVLRYLRQPWDIVILGGYSSPTAMLAIAQLRRMGKPWILEVDGGLIKPDRALVFQIKKRCISAASAWLSSGRASTEYLVHYGADAPRCHLYPFSSLREADLAGPCDSVEKEALRRRLGLNGRTVLYVGRMLALKGIDVLLRAAAEFPAGTELLLIGGEAPEEYRELIRAIPGPVRFLPFMGKAALASYYKAADLLVLPTRGDVWGLVVNEAMACGLPVVATDQCVAGMELIENGVDGYLVPVDDPHTLAVAVGKALENAEEMGAAAFERIRPYTIENMVKAHLSLFRHFIGGER